MSVEPWRSENVAASGWACVLVREVGNWSSPTTDQERGIALAFMPAAKTLGRVVQQHGDLLRTFDATRFGPERAGAFDDVGHIVQALIQVQETAFAVGRIPATQWSQVQSREDNQWVTMSALLIAVYLPFVRGRVWVAIAPEKPSIDERLWALYRGALQLRCRDVCETFHRPDRRHIHPELPLCVYARKSRLLTRYDGSVNQSRGHWDPDENGSALVPIEHIRCGLSLVDFVGHVMVGGVGDEVQKWRHALQSSIPEVDLSEFGL
jgi:hypothetical protein